MHPVLIHGQRGKKENNIHRKNKVMRKESGSSPMGRYLGAPFRPRSSDSHTPGEPGSPHPEAGEGSCHSGRAEQLAQPNR